MSETMDFKEMAKGLPTVSKPDGTSSQYVSPYSMLMTDDTGAPALMNLAKLIPYVGKVDISSLADLDNLGSYGTCVMSISSSAYDPDHSNILSASVLIQFCFFSKAIRQQILISGFEATIWYRCTTGINKGKWHRVNATCITPT